MPNCSKFKPHPYTFTLIDCFDRPMNVNSEDKDKIVAECPPFDILLDHTIAVLWIVFSFKKNCRLRSSQIDWALKFLEGMHNDSRVQFRSEDVRKAISYLEYILLNCISSNKGDKVKEYPKDSEESLECCEDSDEEISCSIEEQEISDQECNTSTDSPLAADRDENMFQSLHLRDMFKDL